MEIVFVASTGAPLPMDHRYIEEQHVADRYLKRQLSHAERVRFEEHFAECAECLDRVALAEMFRESLERSAEEPAVSPVDSALPDTREEDGLVVEFAPVAFSGRLRYQPWQYAAIFGVAAVLIAGLPSLLLITQIRQFRDQAVKAGRESAAALASYASERRRVEALQRQRTRLELQLDGQAAPIFRLRENGPNSVAIPEEDGSVLLVPLREAGTGPVLYRAVVRAPDGRVISDQPYLARGGDFGVVVRSSLLAGGSYTLALEEVPGRKPGLLYPFQVAHTGIER